MIDLSKLSPVKLLSLHVNISEELRTRGIIRTSNNPTGDLAETLFCKALGWQQAEKKSCPNIDAVDVGGMRYQIKARRLTEKNTSRQMSALRDFKGHHFDFLAGLLFNQDYTVFKAAIIPYDIVGDQATYYRHTNSHKFLLNDNIWNVSGVRDVTDELNTAYSKL